MHVCTCVRACVCTYFVHYIGVCMRVYIYFIYIIISIIFNLFIYFGIILFNCVCMCECKDGPLKITM